MLGQARNQLGTPGGAKSFPKGAQIFWNMSNSFKIYPTNFSKGGKKISRGGFAPLVTGLCWALQRLLVQQNLCKTVSHTTVSIACHN